MTALTSHPYKTAWLGSSLTGLISPRVETKTTCRPASPAAKMPASLWRHSQNEDAAHTRHHQVTDRLLIGFAGFSLAGIVYAICQTGSLMSGNRLHDAIAAFMR